MFYFRLLIHLGGAALCLRAFYLAFPSSSSATLTLSAAGAIFVLLVFQAAAFWRCAQEARARHPWAAALAGACAFTLPGGEEVDGYARRPFAPAAYEKAAPPPVPAPPPRGFSALFAVPATNFRRLLAAARGRAPRPLVRRAQIMAVAYWIGLATLLLYGGLADWLAWTAPIFLAQYLVAFDVFADGEVLGDGIEFEDT